MTGAVKERPILFRGPLVRAVLDGRKTQTRRVIKPQPACDIPGAYFDAYAKGLKWAWWTRDNRLCNAHGFHVCPYGSPGDRLWVRESSYIAPPDFGDPPDATCRDDRGRPRVVGYAADMDAEAVRCAAAFGIKLTPSIHTPRWASRITLEITGVRVERVREITEADAAAEGVTDFRRLWDEINATRGCGWDANPWVWVVEFRRPERESQ